MGHFTMRRIVPAFVGAVFGAFVASILLTNDAADGQFSAETTSARPARAPKPKVEAPIQQGALARPDVDVTLRELTAMTDPFARREAALALLEVYGNDAAAVELFASSLPQVEAVNFRIHAIVSLAESDVQGALTAAMALPQHEQRRLALLRLAPALAESDPREAIAAIGEIDAPGLETAFVAALLDHWAVHDPAGLFDYLESTEVAHLSANGPAFEALAANDPERLLAMADDLRRDVATLATTAALEALIDRDAAAALSRIAALRPGRDRLRLETTAAEVYGEQNPEAAWTWATAAQAEEFTRISVVRGIQKVDPDMAWDITLSQLYSADGQLRAEMRPYLVMYISAVASSESPHILVGLDRLLSLNDPQVDASMQASIAAWANRDPEAALDWSLRNLDRIDAVGVLARLSAGLARTNIDLARQTIYRLDEQHRPSWAVGVARTLAESDLAAARNWAFEIPGGPLRDAALHEVIRGEAHGGAIDRQLFDQFSNDTARAEAARSAAARFACDGRMELALEIARAYITEQGLLEDAEQQIEANSGSTGNQIMCWFI